MKFSWLCALFLSGVSLFSGCAFIPDETDCLNDPLNEKCSPKGFLYQEESGNLIPNSSFEEDWDRDGRPDAWSQGSTPSLFQDSATGCRTLDDDTSVRALWIRGGRDGGGEWSVSVSGIEPGKTYILFFHLFRDGFQNGWYPEVEIFGQRTYLNQHATYGQWQTVELLFTAPPEGGEETRLRFMNRYPCIFWFYAPKLRPYRLSWVNHVFTRSGVLFQWEETASSLVLKMEMEVNDGEKNVTRLDFLNVEAKKVYDQLCKKDHLKEGMAGASVLPTENPLAADLGKSGGAKGSGPFFNSSTYREMAWFPLTGKGHFLAELVSTFQGEAIAKISMEGSYPGPAEVRRKDMPGVPAVRKKTDALPDDFFPIGLYDVSMNKIEDVLDVGFNTVHFAVQQEKQGIAGQIVPGELPAKWMLSSLRGRVPFRGEDPEMMKLRSIVTDIPVENLLCIYIADEPELCGASPSRLYHYQKFIKRTFYNLPTSVAFFRTRFLPYYQFCSDWFLVDPYPVPNRPLTWMADELEAAHAIIEKGRVMAVVQAFGGKGYGTSRGWSRFPTLKEMRVLAFLAVVHGAEGIFFYNDPMASSSEEKWEIVTKVVGDLNRIYPWLLRPVAETQPVLWSLTSKGWKKGEGNIHFELVQGTEESSWLLIAVNPGQRSEEIRFEGLPVKEGVVMEIRSGRPVIVKAGRLFDVLPAHAVRIYCAGSLG